MVAEFFSVEPGGSTVVSCAEIYENSCVGFLLIIERFLVPQTVFIVEEVVALGVPVTGDFKSR